MFQQQETQNPAIHSSVILTFVVSTLVGKGKIHMLHIQNATLAGGVTVGIVADENIDLSGAMIVGIQISSRHTEKAQDL